MKLIFRSIAVGNKYPLFLQIPTKCGQGKQLLHTQCLCAHAQFPHGFHRLFECRCEPQNY